MKILLFTFLVTVLFPLTGKAQRNLKTVTVDCESIRKGPGGCYVPGTIQSYALVEQLSKKTRCIQDVNFGQLNNDFIYVDRGCRAKFQIRYIQDNSIQTQQLYCESPRCVFEKPVDKVYLERKASKSACSLKPGVNWSFDARENALSTWNGCRATFIGIKSKRVLPRFVNERLLRLRDQGTSIQATLLAGKRLGVNALGVKRMHEVAIRLVDQSQAGYRIKLLVINVADGSPDGRDIIRENILLQPGKGESMKVELPLGSKRVRSILLVGNKELGSYGQAHLLINGRVNKN